MVSGRKLLGYCGQYVIPLENMNIKQSRIESFTVNTTAGRDNDGQWDPIFGLTPLEVMMSSGSLILFHFIISAFSV